MTRDWLVSVPYPEGGVVRLVRALAEQGRLRHAYTPSRRGTRALASAARPLLPPAASEQLRRAALSPLVGVPGVTEILPAIELTRTVRRRVPRLRRVLPGFDRMKPAFDAAVARRMPPDVGVVVGFPGACLRTFQAAPPGAVKVLYEVDSHPAAHNALLRAHFADDLLADELYGDELRQRIEQEARLADRILVPSRFVQQQFADRGTPPERLLLHRYGVDLSTFRPTTAAVSAAVSSSGARLLYVGSIGFRKGMPFLLEAMRALPDATLDLYGPVTEPALLQDLPRNVAWRGVLDHADLAGAYAAHDAFVFPSVNDSFGLVVAEALACGLPVVITDAVGGAEAFGPRDVTVVPAGDARGLQEALADVRPLDIDVRTARAARLRENGLTDWSAYAAGVIAAVDAADPTTS